MCASAHFVYFIEHQQGIVTFCFDDAFDDASTHRCNIRATMTTDFTFVVHTTEGDALIFASQTFSNTATERSFAYPWRAIKTENRGWLLLTHFHYSQVLKYSLLHLFHTEVVVVEYFLSTLQIQIVDGVFSPRQRQNSVYIVVNYTIVWH